MVSYNRQLAAHFALVAPKNEAISLKKHQQGEKIIYQNEAVGWIYVIQSGVVKCYINESNGKDFILDFFGEGAIIGELEALNDTLTSATVEAITDLTIYRFSLVYFWEMLRTDDEFNLIIMKELAKRASQVAKRASYQQNYALEYSILKLLYLSADLPFTLKKKDLADYLGITLRSLNRTITVLQQKKIIAIEKLNLAITKPEVLRLLNGYEKA